MAKLEQLLARRSFKEMRHLEEIIESLGDHAKTHVIDYAEHKGLRYPLYCVTMGCEAPEAPSLAFFGGVHGLEKIGSEVVLSYMQLASELVKWDEEFQSRLQSSRLVFMPIVNPVGVVLMRRSNGNGVDLMRNAPIDAEESQSGWLYSGHRISSVLPWYRGEEGGIMETESRALLEVVRRYLFSSKRSMSVDVHSGFGVRDRLWFPYAKTRKPYENVAEVTALKKLFDMTYPHHFYKIEPISQQYLVHGDLWDLLVDEFEAEKKQQEHSRFFLPWTLEMGSWLWLRKNPRQLISKLGLFHPMQPHRHHRIMRRHITLFDFLHRSLLYPEPWLQISHGERESLEGYAQKKWYKNAS